MLPPNSRMLNTDPNKDPKGQAVFLLELEASGIQGLLPSGSNNLSSLLSHLLRVPLCLGCLSSTLPSIWQNIVSFCSNPRPGQGPASSCLPPLNIAELGSPTMFLSWPLPFWSTTMSTHLSPLLHTELQGQEPCLGHLSVSNTQLMGQYTVGAH